MHRDDRRLPDRPEPRSAGDDTNRARNRTHSDQRPNQWLRRRWRVGCWILLWGAVLALLALVLHLDARLREMERRVTPPPPEVIDRGIPG